ncbi:DNA-binding GntR family transcriptional regulator [Bradyrhizobium sp. LM6.10]|uniref:GntR family transcriptional regulator n=1 Tax=Bradyrhizobium sp. 174 TaxID=2782645 RepID=UPI001FF80AFA|nr:FCD domain-containing protein [Bradyrhizobium sp. 174]MCK1572816.1 GntR family transcriptional regulator [Bradyrhizobium sp. 174]
MENKIEGGLHARYTPQGHHDGARITTFSPDPARRSQTVSSPEALSQAMAFRAVIEPAAIAQPGYAMPYEVITRLRERQRRVLEVEFERMTIGEMYQCGCDFHEQIIRGAANPFFVESLRRVNSIRRLFAYRSFADHDGIRRHVREHLRLLDLLESRRHVEAAKLMAKHLQRSMVAGVS